jgi:hypothetical protein
VRRRRWASAVGIAAVGVLAFRRWHLRWGATAPEAAAPLPGDELMPDAGLVATRAIDIEAPVGAVWPWIAQLGQARGGFYSYDALENLFGCQIHSARSVVAEWQEVAPGDPIHLAPEVALSVARIERGRTLVLQGGAGDSAPPYAFTWAFVLRDLAATRTRLLVRERYAYRSRWSPLLVEPLALVSFVMTQKMLRGIRDRAGTINNVTRDALGYVSLREAIQAPSTTRAVPARARGATASSRTTTPSTIATTGTK